jgi:ABC-type antimicrobial peptide transport system permease subunit
MWRGGHPVVMLSHGYWHVQVLPGADPLLRAAAWLLLAVVALVLPLACTNLASFLLARALDRGHEVAVRRPLGASRGAVARQMLVESTLLGLGGAAAGLVLALVLLDVLLLVDLPLPYGMRLDLHLGLDWKTLFDWRVLALTVGAGLLAGGFSASSGPRRVRAPISARRSRRAAEEAMCPEPSGGAT